MDKYSSLPSCIVCWSECWRACSRECFGVSVGGAVGASVGGTVQTIVTVYDFFFMSSLPVNT